MLYNCESGIDFLENLDDGQQKLILEYIDPEYWALKFKRNSDIVIQIRDLLKLGGY